MRRLLSCIPFVFLICALALPGCTTRMQASMALAQNDPGEAVRLYRQFLAQHPENVRTRVQLGKALIHAKAYAEAEQELKKTLPHLPPGMPESAEARFYLALTELGKSGPQGALARLMEFRPVRAPELGREVRLEATRASVRSLEAEEVLRRMEAAFARGQRLQRLEDGRPFLDSDD
ncbi:MAG: tetratricopeptide repeat protein [Desulfovibrio sp.]